MTVWRRKYSPEEFYAKCEEYFNDPKINDGVITNCGLRLHLDIADNTWLEYQRDEFYQDICCWAKTKLESWLEKKLLLDNKPVGAIFQLKSAHGRSDQPMTRHENTAYVYVFGNEADRLRTREVVADLPMITDMRKMLDNNPALTRRGKKKSPSVKANKISDKKEAPKILSKGSKMPVEPRNVEGPVESKGESSKRCEAPPPDITDISYNE
jgi:hypothetical protein